LQNGVVLRNVDAEIADAQARLAELDQRREVVTQQLADLNRLRASGHSDTRAAGGSELSAASKIELFRDLFRGRQDVFAARWEKPRHGTQWLLASLRQRVETGRLPQAEGPLRQLHEPGVRLAR
jgi:hypothetical protein